MKHRNPGPSPRLSFRRVAIHFIYSFTLTDESSQIIVPLRAIDDNPPTSGYGSPPERLSIASHLELKPESAWEKLPSLEGTFDSHLVKLDPLLRLFPCGATCCFTLTISASGDERVSRDDVVKLLGITRQLEKDTSVRSWGGIAWKSAAPASLYDLFVQSVNDFCQRVSKKGGPVSWLDQAKELINTKVEAQNPWVVTAAEVEGDAADAFCSIGDDGDDPARTKMMRVRKYQCDIVPLVFRSVTTSDLVLEAAYVVPPTPVGIPGLFSVNIDARLFVTLSRRSILCLCPDLGANPAEYFLPGLLDLCETVRARWHTLIMINKYVDKLLPGLRGPRQTRLERREQLFMVRGMLVSTLEDPTIYIVAGDALSKLYSRLAEIFRLVELKRALIEKMDLVDRIYRDARELDWARTMAVDDSAQGSSKNS